MKEEKGRLKTAKAGKSKPDLGEAERRSVISLLFDSTQGFQSPVVTNAHARPNKARSPFGNAFDDLTSNQKSFVGSRGQLKEPPVVQGVAGNRHNDNARRTGISRVNS